MAIAYGCNNRCRNQWSNALDGSNSLAVRRVLERDLNPVVGSNDLFVKLRQFFIEVAK